MRRGGTILILLGIILGLVTAAGTFITLSTTQQGQQVATRPIVIAIQNIPNRSEIRPDAVGILAWPEASIPSGAFEKVEDVAGKLALEPIYQGQLFLPPMIIDKSQAKDTRTNASFLVPEGKVAVAFSIGSVTGVAGALQPGDTVDLLLTLNPSALQQTTTTRTTTAPTGTEGQPVTQLMLQDVLILQVGTWASVAPTAGQPQAAAAADTITVALDRQDALALKSAREQGLIDLALRHAGDHKAAPATEPVTLQYLNKRFNFNLLPLPTK
ncbi:MAG: Flp pilus assembly protein CpaB [Chloroflexota bacterium]|nr:Flp pilus assembly protein CpaB [Chloroflexota bacterium]